MKTVAWIAFALLIPIAAPSLAQVAGDPAPGIGRLFFSPEKRAALERQRLYNIQEARTLEGATVSLDGVVQRSSGKSTVWINGRAQGEADAPNTGVAATLAPRAPGSALLSSGEDKPTRLKVGEAMNRATGERNDRLGGGVVIPPRDKHPR